MRDIGAAGVRAEADRNAVCQIFPRHGDDAVKDDLAVLLLLVGRVGDTAVKKRIGQRGRERRDLERALLLVERGDRRVRLRAVLDGIHAVFQRHTHALGAFDVRGDLHAKRVRLIAGRLHQRGLHPQHARLADDLGVEHAAGDHELDEVRLLRRDPLHISRGLLRRLCFVGKGAGHVPARHGDRHIGRHHARAEDLSLRGQVADDRVEVRHAADRADGRHAAEKLRLRVALAQLHADAARERVGGDELHELLRVARLFLRLAGGGQMNVQIDQPRQHILSAEVHDLIALAARRGIGDRADASALNINIPPRLRRHLLRAVEQHAVCEHIVCFIPEHGISSAPSVFALSYHTAPRPANGFFAHFVHSAQFRADIV